jgi:hypothetical protein
MVAGIEKITKEILGLPRHQRSALLGLLLDLGRHGTSEEIESAWEDEIRARIKGVDEGRAVGIPYEQIKKEMTDRFPSR